VDNEPAAKIDGYDTTGEGYVDYFFFARGSAPSSVTVRYKVSGDGTADSTVYDTGGTPTAGSVDNTSSVMADITMTPSGGTWTDGSLFRTRLIGKVETGDSVWAGYCRVTF
jgi:hypothetical protein